MPFHSKTNWQKKFQNQNDKNTQIYMTSIWKAIKTLKNDIYSINY